MKKYWMGSIVVLTGALSLFFFLGPDSGSETPRRPASIPENYDSLSGCEKQQTLWERALATSYQTLPEFKNFGVKELWRMGRQEILQKGELKSDIAPEGWVKYLHRHGAMAKIKIVSVDEKFTGVFQGADCGLLRLSLTYRAGGSKPVAPGLALKVLRDAQPSANVSALVSLEGQDEDHNFFARPMSNIVPMAHKFGHKLVHKIFRKVTKYPEELLVYDMARLDAEGNRAPTVIAPRQIFFVPVKDLGFASAAHDVREDFLKIPEGTTLYQIFALSDKHQNYDYSNYTIEDIERFVSDSHHVADVVTTSEFVSSEFGDDGIFFRHEIR